MHRVLVLLLVLSLSSVAYGQIVTGGFLPSPGLLPIGPFIGPSSTAADRDGNLFVFEVTYTYPAVSDDPAARIIRLPAAIKTRVSIISSQGTHLSSNTYDGYYQLLGAGQHAVYAAVLNYSSGVTTVVQALTATRKLVAFIGAGAPIETPISLTGDVRLNSSVDNRPDVISVLEYAIMPLALPPNTAPTRQRQGQLIKFNGGTFDIKPFTIPQ